MSSKRDSDHGVGMVKTGTAKHASTTIAFAKEERCMVAAAADDCC